MSNEESCTSACERVLRTGEVGRSLHVSPNCAEESCDENSKAKVGIAKAIPRLVLLEKQIEKTQFKAIRRKGKGTNCPFRNIT